MIQIRTQSNSDYFVDLNINNKIIKSFTFSNKGSAYSFFLHHLKDISFYYSTKNNYISAILYQKSNGRKKVLSKKNLTKVFLNANI